MIPEDKVHEIRLTAKENIVQVIGSMVVLKQKGRHHVGCCPFHRERSASFYVTPKLGLYKCFGCGQSGGVVAFVMRHTNRTYPEALVYLADFLNIVI